MCLLKRCFYGNILNNFTFNYTYNITYTLCGSERPWQDHLPLKCLLGENGHEKRSEHKQPPHHDQQCEPGRGKHRPFMAECVTSRVQTTTLLKEMELCQRLFSFPQQHGNTKKWHHRPICFQNTEAVFTKEGGGCSGSVLGFFWNNMRNMSTYSFIIITYCSSKSHKECRAAFSLPISFCIDYLIFCHKNVKVEKSWIWTCLTVLQISSFYIRIA